MVDLSDKAITKMEVWTSLKEMDGPKAAGPEGLRPTIVKPPVEILAKPLTGLFNASVDGGPLLVGWLMSTIISVHKGGGGEYVAAIDRLI